jgi:hypothetical protein
MMHAPWNALRRCFPEWLVRIGGLLPLACIGLLGAPEAARCQGYGLTTVADLSTPLPGALGPTQIFMEAVLDGPNVAFTAAYTTGGWGLFLATPSGIVWVTDSDEVIPETSAPQDRIELVGLSGEEIAYQVTADNPTPFFMTSLVIGIPGALARVEHFDENLTTSHYEFAMVDDLVVAAEIGAVERVHSYRISTGDITLIASDGDAVSGGILEIHHDDSELIATDGTSVAFYGEDSGGGRGIYSNRTGTVALDLSEIGLVRPIESFAFDGENYGLSLRAPPFMGQPNAFYIVKRIGGVLADVDQGFANSVAPFWIDIVGSSVAYLADELISREVRSDATGEVMKLAVGSATRPFFDKGRIVFIESHRNPNLPQNFRVVLAHPLSIPALGGRGALALALLLGALGAGVLHRRIQALRA